MIWTEVVGERLVHLQYSAELFFNDEYGFYDEDNYYTRVPDNQACDLSDTDYELNEDNHELESPNGSAWTHIVCEHDCREGMHSPNSFVSLETTCSIPKHTLRVAFPKTRFMSPLPYTKRERMLILRNPTDRPDRKIVDYANRSSYARPHHECRHRRAEKGRPGSQVVDLRVLRVCRQIYVEAHPILWSTNTFSFTKATAFRRFIMTRKAPAIRLLRHLRLEMDLTTPRRHDWDRVLSLRQIKSLSRLRTLRLQILYGKCYSEFLLPNRRLHQQQPLGEKSFILLLLHSMALTLIFTQICTTTTSRSLRTTASSRVLENSNA